MAKLVTVAEPNDLNEAYLLRSRLEAAGIRVFIQNENINAMFPMGYFGGIKVQVNLADSFAAMDVIYDDSN